MHTILLAVSVEVELWLVNSTNTNSLPLVINHNIIGFTRLDDFWKDLLKHTAGYKDFNTVSLIWKLNWRDWPEQDYIFNAWSDWTVMSSSGSQTTNNIQAYEFRLAATPCPNNTVHMHSKKKKKDGRFHLLCI